MRRGEFSGQFQIVVLAKTPVAERKYIVPAVKRMRKLCAELSKDDVPYGVTLSYEARLSLTAPSVDTVRMARQSVAPLPAETKGALWKLLWIGAGVIVLVVLAVAAWFLLASPLPRTLNFGQARLTRASQWTREGVTGGVYLLPGDSLQSESMHVSALVSTTLKTVTVLEPWAHGEYRRPGATTIYDAGTGSESCRIDAPSAAADSLLTIRLQSCKDAANRAVCVEVSELLRQDVATACQEMPSAPEQAACFADVCAKRRSARGAALGTLAADLLGN